MADENDRFYGRPYRDTVTLPSILVMPGDPWPADFHARYPNAFHVPVRIVWREGTSARDDGMSARLSAPAPTAQPRATNSVGGQAPPAEAPAPAAAAAVEGAYSGQGNPAGTFLRVNGFLDRLMGSPDPGAEGAQGRDERKPQDPNAPVPFVDDQGKPVNALDGGQMMRPAGLDPHMFVRQGLKDKEIIKELMNSDPQQGAFAAGSYMAAQLSKFPWYQQWDAQRIGGKNHKEFVDFASVAIGLYAAAAGISEDEILAQQNIAAMIVSSSRKGEKFDSKNTFLPSKNVGNTDTGYRLFREGAIKADEQ